jgi:aryl-phospho-beta-D-glucosidase BglC (GH1 family)
MVEDKSISNMVKTLGLYDAIRYFGGYENLKSMIGDNDIKNVILNSVISKKDKVELIKQLVKEINESLGNQPDEGFWFDDLGKDPLDVDPSFVYDDEITLIQIELFYLNVVVMYYYGGENNSREMGNTDEYYDYLPESILDSIIEYLL